jgi:hypothetical protein
VYHARLICSFIDLHRALMHGFWRSAKLGVKEVDEFHLRKQGRTPAEAGDGGTKQRG